MLVSGPFAEAAVRTWTGAVSSDWLNSTNWSPNGVPAAGDTVNISSGSISFSSPVTFAGQINWTGGTLGTGQLTLTSEAVLTVSGAADKQFGFATLENFGRVVWADAGRLVWTGSGTLLNAPGATWEIVGDGALDSAYGAGGSITNRGTVLKHASLGTNHLSGAFYNQGVVDTQTGALSFRSGGGGSGGEFRAAAGAQNWFVGGTYAWDGERFTGAGANRVAGTVTFNGTLDTANLEVVAGGNLAGASTWSGTGAWTGGTLGTGQLTLTSEAVLTVSGAADKQFGFATLENFGRVVWADAGRLVWTGSGTLLNAPGATWEIVGDGALDSAYGAGGSITNRGTVLKHASLGTNHLSGAFYNQGRVEVTSGAIRLASGVTLAPSSVLSFGISGASASQQGLMMVNGLLQLQGTVEAHLVNGYVPESDQTYLIVQAGTLAGAFANTNIAIPDSAWTFTPEYLVDSVILRAAARTSTPATLSGAWASGSFHLQIAGGVGETYRLDASTNLTDWTTLLVTNLVTPVLEFNDLAATNYPSRFYRSIAVP